MFVKQRNKVDSETSLFDHYREASSFWMVMCVGSNIGWVINFILWANGYFGR